MSSERGTIPPLPAGVTCGCLETDPVARRLAEALGGPPDEPSAKDRGNGDHVLWTLLRPQCPGLPVRVHYQRLATHGFVPRPILLWVFDPCEPPGRSIEEHRIHTWEQLDAVLESLQERLSAGARNVVGR